MFGIFSKSKKTSSKKKKPGKKKSKKGDAEANTEASSQPKSFFSEDAAAPSDSPSSIVSAQEKLDAAKANICCRAFDTSSILMRDGCSALADNAES